MKQQVEIFQSNEPELLKTKMNDWLQNNDVEIIDINYSSSVAAVHGSIINSVYTSYSALVRYYINDDNETNAELEEEVKLMPDVDSETPYYFG